MSPFNLDDYVTVNERLTAFYQAYPDGSIQTDLLEITDKRVIVRATVYRTAADERPSIAHSAMGIPGSTPYTKGSEIENAETSAVGRAIAMLGFEVKRSIASAEEVANKAERPTSKAGEETLSPIGHLSRDGLVVRGQGQNSDLQWREAPDGTHKLGFLLEVGDNKARPQVVIAGPLGKALFEAASMDVDKLEGRPVVIEGDAFEVRSPGRRMFYRIEAARVQTEEWTIPAPAEVGKFDDGEPVPLGLDA